MIGSSKSMEVLKEISNGRCPERAIHCPRSSMCKDESCTDPVFITMVVQSCGVVHAISRQDWHTAPSTKGCNMTSLWYGQGSDEMHWANMWEAISFGTQRVRRSWILSMLGDQWLKLTGAELQLQRIASMRKKRTVSSTIFSNLIGSKIESNSSLHNQYFSVIAFFLSSR